MTAPLPVGFTVVLDRATRFVDGGRALLGGQPTRVLRLRPRARKLIDPGSRTLRVADASSAALAERLLAAGLGNPDVSTGPSARFGPADCTVVIPVRDRSRPLDRLLASLPPDSPVIVVDDGSERPELLAAVAAKHGARLLPLPVNLGPAAARNAGLREAATPYVAFVDSDVVLDAATVPVLLRHFADPKVVLAAPRIVGLGELTPRQQRRPESWLVRYESARSSLDLGPRAAAVRPGTPVAWVPSACLVARVEALRALGGFAAEMRVGEDVDLCWRADAAGGRIRYEPSARAGHDHRAGLSAWFRRKAYYGTGAQPLAARHGAHIAPAVLAPWTAGLVLSLLAQRRWSVPVAAGLWTAATWRIAQRVRPLDHPVREAARLSTAGAVSALAQGGALLTRHWWPATAVACALGSRRIRRAAAVASIADVLGEYAGRRGRRGKPGSGTPAGESLDPVRYALARRLDDLAYGSGVWLSALRARDLTPLRPRIVTRGARQGG